ncbi:MAG: DHA2 family efflux MFS transporter permease subunit [Carboxydocellales bacterium]
MFGKWGKWLCLIAVVLGLSMDIMDMTIVNVAIPDIMLELGTDIRLSQYIVTAYMVTIGVFEPITAYWADTRGMKKIYLLSLFIFMGGSILSALAWNINTLIFFRIIQAVGGGMIMPLALSIVEKTFTKKELPLAMGLMGIPLLIAPAIGPTIGGYLVETYNWRMIFWINLPIGLLAIYASYFLLHEFETIAKKFDFWGFVLSALGFSTLLLALSNGTDEGWTSFNIVFLFFIAIGSLILFFLVEAYSTDPILDLRIFKNRIYSSSLVVTFFIIMSLFGSLFLLPLFLQQLSGLGAMETGMMLLPEVLGIILFIPVSAVLLPRIGGSILTIVGIVIMTLGSLFFVNLDINTSISAIRQYLFIIGVGLGLGIMPSVTLAYSSLPNELVNQGSAFFNMVRQIGSAVGVAILTSLIQQRTPWHYANLATTATPWSYTVQSFEPLTPLFQGLGLQSPEAQVLNLLTLYRIAQEKAAVLAFQDAFYANMILGLIGILPALFLVQKPIMVLIRGEKQS